jgi:hypothetical protein
MTDYYHCFIAADVTLNGASFCGNHSSGVYTKMPLYNNHCERLEPVLQVHNHS